MVESEAGEPASPSAPAVPTSAAMAKGDSPISTPSGT